MHVIAGVGFAIALLGALAWLVLRSFAWRMGEQTTEQWAIAHIGTAGMCGGTLLAFRGWMLGC